MASLEFYCKGKERRGIVLRRGSWGQDSLCFLFKLGEFTACVHADGSDSVEGEGRGELLE